MRQPVKVVTVKNLLVCVGILYLSRWLAFPLQFGFGKVTHGIIYHGDFGNTILMPLVLHLPIALVAAAAGVSLTWIVDSARPLRWVALLAVLYAFLGFFGYRW